MANIRANAQWLKNHSDAWADINTQVAEQKAAVDAIVIPAGALDWPTFGELKAQYSDTAQAISAYYETGVDATNKTSKALHDTAVAYLNVEAENSAEAHKIAEELGL